MILGRDQNYSKLRKPPGLREAPVVTLRTDPYSVLFAHLSRRVPEAHPDLLVGCGSAQGHPTTERDVDVAAKLPFIWGTPGTSRYMS